MFFMLYLKLIIIRVISTHYKKISLLHFIHLDNYIAIVNLRKLAIEQNNLYLHFMKT